MRKPDVVDRKHKDADEVPEEEPLSIVSLPTDVHRALRESARSIPTQEDEDPDSSSMVTDVLVRRNQRRRWTVSGAAALSVVVGAAALGLGLRKHEAHTTARPPVLAVPTSNDVERPPSPIPGPADIALEIALEPANATVTLDGQPLTPSTRLHRDGTLHVIRASADGYVAETRLVAFSGPELHLAFALRPLSKAPARTPRAPAIASATAPAIPATTTTTAPAPPPSPARAHALQIDSTDPWH